MTENLKTPYPNLYRALVNRLKNLYALNVFFKLLNPGRRIEIHHITKNLNLAPDNSVLDIGCGDGYWTNYYASYSGKVTGIDPYIEDIVKAKKYGRKNTEFMEGTSEKLSFSDATFDKVLSVCVFEHLYDDQKAFSEIHRVLKPGGILAATVDSLNAPGISNEFVEWHKKLCYCNQLYTQESISLKLKNAGFTKIDAYYIMGSSLSVWWEKLTEKMGVFSYVLVPIVYPIVYLTERTPQKNGYKLFVKAVK